MFQRLGLRYVLFANKGVLQGLLTKKDVWSIIDGAESRRDKGLDTDSLRQRNTAEGVGLLESDDGTSFASSLDRRPSL
jgi:chloride channel 3/4/5